MSNILVLPQVTATYHIALNGDWVDKIDFTGPPPDSHPLDISGIDFYAELRPTETDPNSLLKMSTVTGTLINEGENGRLRWHVSWSTLSAIERLKVLQAAYMDILAVAEGYRINLFQEAGPAIVNIHPGVTLLT